VPEKHECKKEGGEGGRMMGKGQTKETRKKGEIKWQRCEEDKRKVGRGITTTITGMGNKYYKRVTNTNINRINIMKKRNERFKVRNDKQMGR
jgi:hypothetical protein